MSPRRLTTGGTPSGERLLKAFPETFNLSVLFYSSVHISASSYGWRDALGGAPSQGLP
jgi:hypothetical protein